MAQTSTSPRTRPDESAPLHFRAAVVVGILSAVYAVLHIGFVAPYLWPSGHGAALKGDSTFIGGTGDTAFRLARPPDIAEPQTNAAVIESVQPKSPAANAGLRPGDTVLEQIRAGDAQRLNLDALNSGDGLEQLRLWRRAYWLGVRGDVQLRVAQHLPAGGVDVRDVDLERRPVWADGQDASLWTRRHLGALAQLVVFLAAAGVLLVLRSHDRVGALIIMALALCGVGNSGALMGSEAVLPPALREAIALFGFLAAPLATAVTGLAIMHFPTTSDLVEQRPWLAWMPFIAAAPMILTSAATGLFVVGVDALSAAAVWDARHPLVYFGSFGAALLVNGLATADAARRYRLLPDANERRRVRVTMLTAIPGIFAYILKLGFPVAALLVLGRPVEIPFVVSVMIDALVVAPGFGIAYAVAVHRVLAPRLVLRRSVQYALARNTLTVLTAAPAALLVWALVRGRDMSLASIVSGAPGFYLATLATAVVGLRYRERARTWLDQRFFKSEYDAREILLSLAGRVRLQTDPTELSMMIVSQIDQALHPKTTAILVSGIEDGRLVPVSILHGSAESLPMDGGIVTLLGWSDDPLELFPEDPRSPARRLPPDEQAWLECTGASLIVPIHGQERRLIGMIVLGERQSEDPYTAEDRQLLASIAIQIGLGFDVARLKRIASSAADAGELSTMATGVGAESESGSTSECPACGRCEEVGVKQCPSDGAVLIQNAGVPRLIERRYRVDQLVGRGGMGAVYRARDLRLERDVALKVVLSELLTDPEARTRFRREAQLVARLQHPCIVSIFDYGALPRGGAYLAMELIRGEDLRRVLQREGALPPPRALKVLDALCNAVDAAHREGILHRDLKPENVLTSVRGGVEEVKILDFGVAKLLNRTQTAAVAGRPGTLLTTEGAVIGTPAYMAPEQLRGTELDPRADLFALGVMAYEMFSGELPFGIGSAIDIAMAQAKGPPPMKGAGRRFPHELERVIRTAIDPDPARRPASPLVLATMAGEALTNP